MGIFNPMGNWEDRLTLEDLDEMEANGQDVTELRKKVMSKLADIEKLGETDLNKLKKYEAIPRSVDTEFFKDYAGKAPLLFGKQKFFEENSNAKIVYPIVVQAADLLYKPGDISDAMIILLRAENISFDELRKLRDLLLAMRDGEVEVPNILKKIVKNLNNPTAYIEGEFNPNDLDSSFTSTVAKISTLHTSQGRLPNSRIPNEEVLLCLGHGHYIKLIDGKWYI